MKMQTKHTAPAAKTGFTLIELLVVIAIIAILAAILFPVFARARENARRSSCQSNLKQVGLGILQYTQDYDETLPVDWNTGIGDEASNWVARTIPYIKSAQVFVCPSNPNKTAIPGPTLWPGGQTGASHPNYIKSFHSSYAYNRNLSKGPASTYTSSTTNVPTGLKLAALANVSKTVMATDGAAIPDASTPATEWAQKPGAFLLEDMNPARDSSYLASTSGTYAPCVAGPYPRHLETSTVLWADGHVKSQKIETFYVTTAGADSPCLDPTTGCP